VSNGGAIVEQWRQVHGVGVTPDLDGSVDGYPHRAWRDADGRIVLEEYLITGMGHGTPLATSGDDACGTSGPYMLDVAISSTRHIAAAWGITEGRRQTTQPPEHAPVTGKPASNAGGIGTVIEDALRAAGLMR
jgi:poly(3-hydroxybutyrate) depolymerase